MSQIRLRILGESVIQVGETIVEPSATHLFALLLYLAIERGKLIPRGQLASMLFPEANARNAGHNLRQLLYRLRRMGVPLETTAAAVKLPAASVVEAPEATLTRSQAESIEDLSTGFALLPSYSPPTSALSRWLEEYRDRISGKLLRRISHSLIRARQGADWTAVDYFARAVLELDPLNETAALGLAEAMARTGSKHKAVKLLADFAQDVGDPHQSLALPSHILRKRISEDAYTSSHRGPRARFVGRSEDIRELTQAWTVARSGSLCIVTVTGETSIGKSRVLEEFAELVRLDGTGHIHYLRALPGDRDRPMSMFSDICRQVLQLPGAVGCSPQNLSFAKQLSDASKQQSESVANVDAEASERNIRRAVIDLLECVASERPLLLVIDDAHQLDAASRSFLSSLPDLAPTTAVLFLLASNRDGSTVALGRTLRLGPLSDNCSEDLADQLCDEECYNLSTPSRDWCVSAAAGNPGHLTLLLKHATTLGDFPTAPPGLVALLDARLESLSAVERHVLQACAIFGSECCPATIEALTGITGYDLLVTLERLAEGSLVADSHHGIQCRTALFAGRVDQATPRVVRRLLHKRAAEHLEQHVAGAPASQGIAWRIANHWQAAGERARSLEWRRNCWQQSLSIGQPLTAVDAIRSQLGESNTIHERAVLLGDLALALQSAGDWPRLLETLHERRSLSDAVGDDALHRLALAADIIEARRQAYEDITPLVADLQVLIHSPLLDGERRIRAARTLVIVADCLLDLPLALEAVEAVTSTPHSAAATTPAQEALLIFHAVFGERSAAIQIANYLEAAATSEVISTRVVATLTNSIYARRIVEGGETNYRPLIALYDKCVSASMADAAIRVASRIGSFLAEDGEFDGATLWARRARDWKARSEDKRLGCDYLSLEFDLALRDGNHERALMLVGSVLELFPPYASPRFAKERLVTEVRQKLIVAQGPIDEPTIARLLEWHHRAKRLGRHDDHMEALWGALVSVGRGHEASQLLADYVLYSRRERRRFNYWLATRTSSDPFWMRHSHNLLPGHYGEHCSQW